MFYDEKATKQMMDSTEEEFTCYKMYRYRNKHGSTYRVICSPWQRKCGLQLDEENIHPNETIVQKSNREEKDMTKYELESCLVDYGIHVFLDETYAKKEAETNPFCFIVPVTCKKKDLVAAGYWSENSAGKQAVFMEIHIKSNDLIEQFKE